MQVQGEDGESMSGEQVASLDDTEHARFAELHVSGTATGKSKYFRLHLHLLARLARAHDAKRLRTLHDDTQSWASFESAPIGISRKTAGNAPCRAPGPRANAGDADARASPQALTVCVVSNAECASGGPRRAPRPAQAPPEPPDG